MIHEILPVGILRCNCSILGDEATKEAIVVDPGDNIDEIERILAKHGLRVKAIIVTHAHIDHVAGAKLLKDKTGAPVYMNSNDAALLDALDQQALWLQVPPPERVEVDTDARDALSLKLGESDLHVLFTPGHTEGSISLYLPQEAKLIAGDTLFRDSIGRTDLPGGDSHQILSSIKTKLLVLPQETVVIPGHGPSTTIAREKEWNPFLRNL
jgi:glyoxylase-like metal-dependent hydrolase (beta-lactamase superfamily II)